MNPLFWHSFLLNFHLYAMVTRSSGNLGLSEDFLSFFFLSVWACIKFSTSSLYLPTTSLNTSYGSSLAPSVLSNSSLKKSSRTFWMVTRGMPYISPSFAPISDLPEATGPEIWMMVLLTPLNVLNSFLIRSVQCCKPNSQCQFSSSGLGLNVLSISIKCVSGLSNSGSSCCTKSILPIPNSLLIVEMRLNWDLWGLLSTAMIYC